MIIEMEFLIERGHDGPARFGNLKLGTLSIPTPTLIAGVSIPDVKLAYWTVGRDAEPESKQRIAVLPSLATIDSGVVDRINSEGAVLLPSLPPSSSLGPEFAMALLREQLSVLDYHGKDLAAPHAIVRIPPRLRPEDMDSLVSEFAKLGVRAAAFLIDGSLGPEDMRSLSLRARLPCNWLALALGRVNPSAIPMLCYLGFDVIDVGRAAGAAFHRVRLWPMGSEDVAGSGELRYCPCHACMSWRSMADASSRIADSTLISHNVGVYESLLSESVQAAHAGHLRYLVESMTHSSTAHATILRVVDKRLYGYLEEFASTSGGGVLPLIGPESYNSPVVRRFREYVASRYAPPKHKKLVVVLPCSARKPYSDSKSHKLFTQAIDFGLQRARHSAAEAVVTSPLGVVPRELERAYPASVYDVPVTGDWDAEEVSIAGEALAAHLAKFDRSVVVVAHVAEGYEEAMRAAESRIEQSIVYTTDGHSATSKQSLEGLREALRDLRDVLSLPAGPRDELGEILRATADYQFGSGAGEALVPETSALRGKPYGTILCRVDGAQTCAFVGATGSLSLTIEGARRIAPLKRYWVRFDGDHIEGGSVFAVAVREADPGIRPGDEVVIIGADNAVLGVGRSEMSGREMCEFERGRAVSVRHKVG